MIEIEYPAQESIILLKTQKKLPENFVELVEIFQFINAVVNSHYSYTRIHLH